MKEVKKTGGNRPVNLSSVTREMLESIEKEVDNRYPQLETIKPVLQYDWSFHWQDLL